MIIISSHQGIFDASGCSLSMAHSVELILIHLSSGEATTLESFETADEMEAVYEKILGAIKAGERFIEISG